MKILNKIEKYYSYFKTNKRDNGEIYIYLDDKAPKKLENSVYNAHGNMFPNDWIYSTYAHLLMRMQDYEPETIEDLQDLSNEIIDGEIDIYTSDLTEWLHSHNSNVYYLTEALEEMEIKDGFQLLSYAQSISIREIFDEIINLLEK